MRIELIDFGGKMPERAHHNDAGADVFAYTNGPIVIKPYAIAAIPLGIGLALPDGLAAFVLPRSGLSSRGLTAETVPIDSGYTGQIHAIVCNMTDNEFIVTHGMKIAQLVIVPVVLANFEFGSQKTRGSNGFGSTGV